VESVYCEAACEWPVNVNSRRQLKRLGQCGGAFQLAVWIRGNRSFWNLDRVGL